MDEGTLIARLATLDPPSLERTRERAAAEIPARLRASAETANQPDYRAGVRFRAGARPWAVAALACALLVTFSLFTPPGQAVTSWMGERLGFGQPGGAPALRQLRAGWTKGTVAEGQPAHVLVVGPVPGGGRYEYVTYRPDEPKGVRQGRWRLDAPCFELDLTQKRSSYGGGCGVLPEGPHLAMLGVSGGGMPGDEFHFFSGRTSMAVDSIEAELNGKPLNVELTPIPTEFVGRFHLGRPFKFFIGFIEGPFQRGALIVTARDASGAVLVRRRSESPNFSGLLRR